jgi:signal transduction histidine kinase
MQVQDTGSGIATERLGQIFAPLYTTKPGGTGLGLYIVQEIVAAHGGQLTVQSGEGRGSTFTITLPGLHTRRPGRMGQRARNVYTGIYFGHLVS